jgi:hypothetical protein
MDQQSQEAAAAGTQVLVVSNQGSQEHWLSPTRAVASVRRGLSGKQKQKRADLDCVRALVTSL